MRRRFRRTLRQWGVPQDRNILLTGLLAVVGLSLIYLLVSDKIYANFGFLWGEKTQVAIPYEKKVDGRVIRQGVFSGEVFLNQETGCLEIQGKTKEEPFGIVKEKVSTRNCVVIATPIR